VPAHRIPFRAGSVLSRSFGIWARNVFPFTILALLIQGPLIAFALLVPIEAEVEVGFYVLAVKTIPWALRLITAGPVAYGVFQQLRGTPARLLESVTVGMSRMIGVIAVATVVFLLIVGVLFAGFVAIFLVLQRASLFAILAGLPAVLLSCVFFVAIPAAVVEGRGVFGSMSRSAVLTKGARTRIFRILLVIIVLGVGVEILAHVIASRIEVPRAALPANDEASRNAAWMEHFIARMRWDTLVCLIGSAIVSGLSAVASVVTYYDLRMQKELVGLEGIASVFD